MALLSSSSPQPYKRSFQLRARQDRAWTQHQGLEHRVLTGRQRNRHAALLDLTRRRVKGHGSDLECRFGAACLTPHDRADARKQFVELERLDDVVVGAASRPRTRLARASRAVTTMTGVRSPRARIASSTAMPSRCGRPRSSRTRSKRSDAMLASAARPSRTQSTAKPDCRAAPCAGFRRSCDRLRRATGAWVRWGGQRPQYAAGRLGDD
jgi:hypothetical protein